MHSLLLLLLVGFLQSVAAQDGVAVVSTAVVLALIGLCIGICCCAGVGVFTVCRGGLDDYERNKDPDLVADAQ